MKWFTMFIHVCKERPSPEIGLLAAVILLVFSSYTRTAGRGSSPTMHHARPLETIPGTSSGGPPCLCSPPLLMLLQWPPGCCSAVRNAWNLNC